MTYRLRLGINRALTPGTVVTLNSGVVNWRRFELPPPFRFRIGVAVAVAGFFWIIFNSIKSFVLDDAASAPIADAADIDGAELIPEFVLIAIVIVVGTALDKIQLR